MRECQKIKLGTHSVINNENTQNISHKYCASFLWFFFLFCLIHICFPQYLTIAPTVLHIVLIALIKGGGERSSLLCSPRPYRRKISAELKNDMPPHWGQVERSLGSLYTGG